MTKEQAYQIVATALAQLQTTLDNHQKLQNALKVLAGIEEVTNANRQSTNE